jgi:ribosomal protein S16
VRRLRYWLGVGAQPSDRVALDSAGITQNATLAGTGAG